MADDADRAQCVEDLQRDRALADVLGQAVESPLLIDGLECCRDCAEPIPSDRLRAHPQAARCVECQGTHEQRQQGYR